MPGPARKGFPVHDFQSANHGSERRSETPRSRFRPESSPNCWTKRNRRGFSHSTLNDVVDEWLNFGYCRVTDHVSNDIALTPEGDEYFGHRTIDE